MNQSANNPRVGIGVMVFRDFPALAGGKAVKKVLFGKRKSVLGAGDWSFPGGHLEAGESLVACAIRETLEETGSEIMNIQFQLLGNIPDTYATHYVQIAFTADWKAVEPSVMEPTKCERWEWRTLDDLPEPLFVPTRMMIDALKEGKNFLDSNQ